MPNPERPQILAKKKIEEEDSDIAMLNMDGSDLNLEGQDYEDSLHYRISKQIKSKRFQTRGQKLGLNMAKFEQVKTKIKFGKTDIKEYQQL